MCGYCLHRGKAALVRSLSVMASLLRQAALWLHWSASQFRVRNWFSVLGIIIAPGVHALPFGHRVISVPVAIIRRSFNFDDGAGTNLLPVGVGPVPAAVPADTL